MATIGSLYDSVSDCPWCGAGTALELRGDGLGRNALWCAACQAKGPSVPIAGDFEDADRAAVAAWSRRASPAGTCDRALIERVAGRVAITRVLAGGELNESSQVEVDASDLLALVENTMPPRLRSLPQTN